MKVFKNRAVAFVIFLFLSLCFLAAGNLILNLIVTLPYSEITGPINKHAKKILGLAGLVIILLGAGGLAFFKSQKEKARLETEARYLKQIANGAKELAAERDRRMELSKQLKLLTFIDGLTGIANHRHFDEFLENEWQRNMRAYSSNHGGYRLF